MAICPHCKEQIQDYAKKCHHCGLWVTKVRRLAGAAKTFLECVTFIAAVCVLWVLYHQNAMMKEQLEIFGRQTKEELRPRIDISTPKLIVSDTAIHLFVDINNIQGHSDAEQIIGLILVKVPGSAKDTLTAPFKYDKMTIGNVTTVQCSLPLIKKDFCSKIDVRYRWRTFGEDFANWKYFKHFYDKEKQTFSTRKLDEIQIKECGF